MASKKSGWQLFGNGKTYADRVHRPLQCLIFITPLLLIYQIGSALQSTELNQAPQHVLAFVYLLKFFAIFGAAGNYLPLLAVVIVLLFWHAARKDKWDVEPPLYVGMSLESIAWALPVFIMGLVLTRHFSMSAMVATNPGGSLTLSQDTVLSIGAGIYEEFVFRLIAITLLNIVLVDLFKMKLASAIPIIIVVSAIAFSCYHYLGQEAFAYRWNVFFFRTAAGIYFAGIFIFRGFGVTVGCHAVYDLMVVFFNHLHR
jgi:hypothetical protein